MEFKNLKMEFIPFYHLEITTYPQGEETIENKDFDSLEGARNYARQFIIKRLNFLIVIFKLYDELIRRRFSWCPDFNDIFIYNHNKKKILLKNPNYCLISLFKLTQAPFLDEHADFLIFEISPVNKK